MLGISDPWVAAAYVLCILSALLCVGYAWLNWNKGDDQVVPADVKWVEHEKKAAEEDL